MDQFSVFPYEVLVDKCTNQDLEIKRLNKLLQTKDYKIQALKFKLRRMQFKDPALLMKEARRLRNEVSANFGSAENEF